MDEKIINYGNRAGMRRRRRRYNVKKIIALLVILIAIIVMLVMGIISLFKKNIKKVETKEEKKEEVEEIIIKPWENVGPNETISSLSGLPVSKEEASKRPVAIMYHNRLDMLPQAGLSKADIVYEIPTDGEIVALLGIFQDISGEKYGPIRSIRKQVLDFGFDNDAILVHYKSGEIPTLGEDIVNTIKTLNSPSIDAGSYEDKMTTSQVVAAGAVQAEATTSTESKVTTAEQTLKFVTGSGIKEIWAEKGFAKMREPEKQISWIKLGPSDETKYEKVAKVISIPYSYYQISEFRFDPKSGTYKRFQNVGYKESQQMDSMGTTSEDDDTPLEYKNIIIQYVDTEQNSSTKNVEINPVSSGDGLYFTNGTYMPIKWSKDEHYNPTKYKSVDGTDIAFNRGRTWICIVPKNIAPTISEEAKDAGKTRKSKTSTTSKKTTSKVAKQASSYSSSVDETSDIGTIAGIDAMPSSARK